MLFIYLLFFSICFMCITKDMFINYFYLKTNKSCFQVNRCLWHFLFDLGFKQILDNLAIVDQSSIVALNKIDVSYTSPETLNIGNTGLVFNNVFNNLTKLYCIAFFFKLMQQNIFPGITWVLY